MIDKQLIGLTKNFGRQAFRRLVDAGLEASDAFDKKVLEFMSSFRLRSNPWEPAADFLKDEILPVMNKDNELECYMVMYLIRHLGSGPGFHFDKGSSWGKYANEESHFGRIHPSYSGRFEAVIRSFLEREDVKGTAFESYLRFPEQILALDPDSKFSKHLFAITYDLSPL